LKKLFSLFFSLIAVNSFAASGPLQSQRYFKNSGGLIDHISPLLTPDTKASAISNFTLDDRGQLTGRAGFRILNTTGTMGSSAVTGGGYHNATVGTSFFAVIVGTNVYRTSNSFNTTYTNVTGTVTITAGATNLAQHTALNDAMVFCNELDTPFKVTSSGNAMQLLNVSTGAKTCTTYGSYLVIANTSESGILYPSRIRWSDINNPDAWPALNFIDIEPSDGDRIVSVITFKDSVYVFKKRSIYRLMITGLDGADAFIARPFSRNLGCWAKNSVRVIPNLGIAFLAQNTLYVLGDNELSSYNYSQFEPVGDPIQRTFDSVGRAQWANAVGAVYPKRYQYVLYVSTTGTTNAMGLVYDYIQKAWTTYTGMSINMADQAEDNTGQNLLISGDYSGNVYKLDETISYDTAGNVQAAIPTSYTTGWLTQDTPEFTKNYKYLYVFTQVNSTATITATAAFDYGLATEYTQTVGLGSKTAVYGTAIYDIDTYALSGNQSNRFEINRSAKAIKLTFTGSSIVTGINIIGWSIIYTNEDWRQ
jgi:hypothetical protein